MASVLVPGLRRVRGVGRLSLDRSIKNRDAANPAPGLIHGTRAPTLAHRPDFEMSSTEVDSNRIEDCIVTNGVTPAGWYQDPTGQGNARFWNGVAWTQSFDRGGVKLNAAITIVRRGSL